jgi:hypothetical protein
MSLTLYANAGEVIRLCEMYSWHAETSRILGGRLGKEEMEEEQEWT